MQPTRRWQAVSTPEFHNLTTIIIVSHFFSELWINTDSFLFIWSMNIWQNLVLIVQRRSQLFYQHLFSLHSGTERGVMIMMIFDILIWAPDIEVLTKIYVQASRSEAKTHELLFHYKSICYILKHIFLNKEQTSYVILTSLFILNFVCCLLWKM